MPTHNVSYIEKSIFVYVDQNPQYLKTLKTQLLEHVLRHDAVMEIVMSIMR